MLRFKGLLVAVTWCSLYNNIHPPTKWVPGADLYCFKHKIEPKWEDPICTNGGKWTMMFPKATLESNWLNTVFVTFQEFIVVFSLALLFVGCTFWRFCVIFLVTCVGWWAIWPRRWDLWGSSELQNERGQDLSMDKECCKWGGSGKTWM